MPLTGDNTAAIEILHQEKEWGTYRILRKFPNKNGREPLLWCYSVYRNVVRDSLSCKPGSGRPRSVPTEANYGLVTSRSYFLRRGKQFSYQRPASVFSMMMMMMMMMMMKSPRQVEKQFEISSADLKGPEEDMALLRLSWPCHDANDHWRSRLHTVVTRQEHKRSSVQMFKYLHLLKGYMALYNYCFHKRTGHNGA